VSAMKKRPIATVTIQAMVSFGMLFSVCHPAAAETTRGPGADETIDDAKLLSHIPDPEQALTWHAHQEKEVGTRKSEATFHRDIMDLISPVKRPERMWLTLPDALHRALANSFAIRIESYNPAIETTRVVEAEAVFDAVFFLNVTNNKQNVPTTTIMQGTQAQTFNMQGGIRQLLPTGMAMTTSLSLSRNWQKTDPRFQTVNPAYFSAFVVDFRQPLLRGFGLDYNRSQIRVSKNNRRVADLAFRRRVRDTMLDTETAFWQLAQARRLVPISARLVAAYRQLYGELYERRDFDVLWVTIAETKARLEAARSDHVRVLNEVRNAEDRLIVMMNDAAVDLADVIEIIPADSSDVRSPVFIPCEELLVDRLAEVQAALDHREELGEAKLQIDNAKIYVGAAKNEALPSFDLLFRYTVDGLGKSADAAFDEVTKNDFHEYFVGVELELPVGNRSRRAALQRARLQYAQAIAGLEQTFEQVILDVNVSVRKLETSHDVIQPNYASMQASEERLNSIIARAERKDWFQLNQELTAHQALANSRRATLDSLANYNIAIVGLEKAKGTLLEYNGVSITAEAAP